MKKVYTMTEAEAAEFDAIFDKSKDASKWQGKADKIWERLGKKYGFFWQTAEPVKGPDPKVFKAVPTSAE